jgi:ketopantoate reductase
MTSSSKQVTRVVAANGRVTDPPPPGATRGVRGAMSSRTPSGALRVLICGSGAGGHVLAGLLSAQGDVDTRVFTMNSAKVARWRSIATRERLVVVERDAAAERTVAESNAALVTDDPGEAARGCDLAFFVLPAFLHARYLAALAPFLEDGCVLVGLPGQPGFEFDVREILDSRSALLGSDISPRGGCA